MDLKIRNVPEDQVLVIQRKARKFGVSREEYLRRVIQEKAEEDELRVQEKYHKEVLDLKFQEMNIAEILDMTVNQALEFFKNDKIRKQIDLLREVGLGYLKLGQSLSTLSGGESQRLKIATELKNESNIYIMDEPTTGLHMSDIENFRRIVGALVDKNNTVIIIEHNPDIIKHADWIIDMGPEGGKAGGREIRRRGYF